MAVVLSEGINVRETYGQYMKSGKPSIIVLYLDGLIRITGLSPTLSLPSMLVINKVIGPKKTIAYVTLVVIMATITGVVFGLL